MKKINVILYTRVSTDEQADGLSREAQERQLRAYCQRNGYNIVGEDQPYKEDYSAKHYDMQRPELKRIYNYCKKHRKEVDKILFLRWDRFSRNVEFAFAYKRKFYDELGIEINAIESPIDFTGTEWSTSLAIHCGLAHSEDNKISARTKDGNHEHLMRGEWIRKAPRGYKNVRIAKHECWVEVDKDKSTIIKKIFEEVAKGLEAPAVIRKRLCPYIPKTSFFEMLRNPFYKGVIRVPAYKDDPETFVEGKHEPLIDSITFDKVQEAIDIKRRKKKGMRRVIKKDKQDNLFLRRFITCPICGASITGATSTGNGGKYTYYMCAKDHKHIHKRVEDVNNTFVKYISQLRPNKGILELYNEILLDIRGDKVRANNKEADKLEMELKALKERIDRVNDMFFDGEISRSDREEAISRYNKQADNLTNRISSLRISKELKVQDKLDYSINIIGNLAGFFSSAPIEAKIMLLGSMFPEKIEFDGKNYRTNSYDKMLDVIYQETNQLRGNKKAESLKKSRNSALVPLSGIEPLP